MIETAADYVVRTPEGGWRVSGSRVSLDSIVQAYLEGSSPEAIAASFPTLSLEQIHGTIAFYLRNRGEVDQYLQAQDARWERFRQESDAAHAPLLARLRENRSSIGTEDSPE